MIQLKPAKIDPKILRKLLSPSSTANWKSGTNAVNKFKEEITDQLYILQSQRCAYCQGRFMQARQHRDHIAPQGASLYPQWTFHPWNIVLSCYDCNTVFKGKIDTVSAVHRYYRKVKFTIVHPYLDNPADHLRFRGHHSGILIQAVEGSSKGQTTIQMFDLASASRTKQRAKDLKEDDDLKKLSGRRRLLMEKFLSEASRLIPKVRI